MTWMPDRDPSARRRRRRSGSQNPLWSLPRELDWSHDDLSRRRASTHRLGIPRILGRRARWVGARLRRES
jgi:hypothetical protein